ncbi:MAG: ferritin family protein [Pseudomonadota bacterium]
MTLEEAIKTAINYETKVRGVYQEAVDKATDDKGRKVFTVLRDEEQGHLDYLAERHAEWKKSGHVTAAKLGTVIPSKQKIAEGIKNAKKNVAAPDYAVELDMLKKALALELETGNFYKKMVAQLDAEGQAMFRRFVEIEDGHYAIVQAQMDAISGNGFWFDSMEFNLEMG